MTDEIVVEAEVIEPASELAVTYTPAIFKDNLAALEAYVDEQIAPYIGAQIDPNNYDTVKDARKCMADLNKIKDPIEQERKRIKKAYEEPLKHFEAKVKAITSKIDEARAALKVQVDEADKAFKDSRREMLEEEYYGCAGVMADVIPFSAILDDKWLNRSTNEIQAQNELYEKAQAALKNYETLCRQNLNHKDEVVKCFAETLDLGRALELENTLTQKDVEMAEFKAAQEVAEGVKEQRQLQFEEVTDEQKFLYTLSMEFVATKAKALEVAHALAEMGVTGSTIRCKGEVND